MQNKNINNNKLLKMGIILIPFFLIAFFIFKQDVSAAYFRYKDFSFDEFVKQNAGYWMMECSKSAEEESDIDECVDGIIESQRGFYTKLYKTLAKYESKGLFIDDKIIIMTVFFQLNPDLFDDLGEDYAESISEEERGYNIDENDEAIDIDSDYTLEYWENEEDSIKLLTKAMIGYKEYCYGKYEETYTDDQGNTKTIQKEDLVSQGSIGFADYMAKKFNVLSFLGVKTDREKQCTLKIQSMPKYTLGSHYEVGKKQEVVEDNYWDFLIESNYFDKKPHLAHYYINTLNKTGHNYVSELTDAEIEENHDLLVADRTEIVTAIKELLENYGKEDNIVNYTTASSSSFWWPIGSDETTNEGGKIFAIGDPVQTTITSYYGYRTDPVNGSANAFHGGIDISNGMQIGTVNIIASREGIVSKVSTGCKSYGDTSCGGGYGNYVMIKHSDGMYTLYAHLHENTITVSENQSVSQGEVIGKMGSSGKSTGMHLHFEVRTDETTRVDPLNYVSMDNPRPEPSSANSNLVQLILEFEGAPTVNGDSYNVYCHDGDIPTVSPGITLKYNANRFIKYGINLTTSNDYYNYCGTTMPKDICDKVYLEIINDMRETVKGSVTSHGLTLADNQIDALTSLMYNHGNINGFFEAYETYGNNDTLCTNWWNNYAIMSGTSFEQGLRSRRQKECSIFVHGY